MKAEYTKGEWHWDGDPSNYNKNEEAPWLIADNHVITGEIMINNPADAKLIAAAPELLEALNDLVNAYDSSEEGRVSFLFFDKAREAIKKATE